MSKTLVDIQNLTAGYGENIVLRNVSLKIYGQDFLAVAGANGGGKTTLVKTILGLLKPLAGAVIFPDPTLKNRTGYMPQIHLIDRKFPICASEVIESGLMAAKNLSKSEKKAKIAAIAQEMDIENILRKPVGELSGGQLQRVLLARAIVNDPELLILDEPNSYLDRRFETNFYRILKTINQTTAIVLVSHNVEAVLPMAKHVAVVEGTVEYKTQPV
ncbi:MAG: ATP-binding cassette domain-containing protein [Dysgonamonadaceae bacterium]|jgi:zinc transport system ATP-binding protein|nr:ATP-binding cassette domain-containing protein [Dysgonamonadaceae bacterium]